MIFKLKDGVTTPITIRYMEKHGSSNVYTHKDFVPGKFYEMDEDDVARDTLLSFKTKVKSSNALKELFDENGIEYKMVKPTCHCQKSPFMEFNPVEEVRDESY